MAAAEARGGLAATLVRRRWPVMVAWLAATALLAPAAARVEHDLEVSAQVGASASARVDELLRERFTSPFAPFAVLVVTGGPPPDTPAGELLLGQVVAEVESLAMVTRTISYLTAKDPLLNPTSGDTFLIVGLDALAARPDALVPPLRAATAALAAKLRPDHPELELAWTGDSVINHDIRRTSASEVQRAERQVLPVTLLLLLLAFGAVAAALLPLAVAAVAIIAALGASVLITTLVPLSILLENVVVMLGLGVGIDYALLMVSRFREELAAGHGPEAAAVAAARGAGHTILLSAAAVLIGFTGLLFIPLNELRGVAVGGAAVVIAAALTAVVPLPGLLAALGQRVNAGRFGRRTRAAPVAPHGQAWRRWGAFVAAYPLPTLLLSAVPLVLLVWPLGRIETSLPRANWLPPSMESARGLAALDAIGAGGVVQQLRVIVELGAGESIYAPAGWAATRRVVALLRDDPRVARVQSLATLLPAERFDAAALAMFPDDLAQLFVSTDQSATVIEVIPRSTDDFPSLTRLARELRERLAQAAPLPAGGRVSIGGLPAFNADYEDAIAGRFGLVVALVVGGTLLALAVGFRSLLVPLKAVALNLMSVAAALGLVVLVFQEGHGAQLFGLSAGLGSLFPALPALVFCIVFGLSMDYEVFLVARVREAWRAGSSDGEALAEGLARTGGVITSAAAIMIVVFAAFTLGGFVMIKVLGFALAAAVLIDVTIVRLALGPALLRLAGRWNWWPGDRRGP